jgi:rhamnogalacturonyl hydrolase YesR
MFAYGLNEGAREGWLDDSEGCRRAAMKCFLRLAGSLDGRGNVPGVCVGTGAKDNRQYYLDRARINGDPHGQAPLLWLVNSLMQRKCHGW